MKLVGNIHISIADNGFHLRATVEEPYLDTTTLTPRTMVFTSSESLVEWLRDALVNESPSQ